jgi:tRNA threonylcarbamoyl adenosine modification protein YeaZ
MNILAIDTAANLCAACVYDATASRELGRSVRDIGKGHAEVLMDVIGEALAAAGGEKSPVAMTNIGAVAVSVGPGSFTGIRVGVSVARGLALALKIPAVGVGTLEALAFEARREFGEKRVLAAIDGGRDGTYAAVYDGFGKLIYDPAVAEWATIVELAGGADVVAGSAARRVAEAAPSSGLLLGPGTATADIASYVGVALATGFAGDKPRPLYLRAPDARPQAHLALPRRPS